LKWVEGNLHAPKGMALLDGKLYVTDINEVKIIDVASATIEKTMAVKGAVFLNDVATDGQQVYFSDTRAGNIYALAADGSYTIICMESNNILLYALNCEGLKKFIKVGEYTQEIINTGVIRADGILTIKVCTFVASR